MATAHLSVKVGKVGKGTPHAEYISRVGKYAQRLEQGEKLEATESGNMPKWAQDNPTLFWQAADQYERKNGYVYREHEIALPRELNAEQRAELVREWVSQELGDKHAYTWAIHNKTALDGGEQPHVHLMFSERMNDGIERDPEQYFKRYNAKYPECGGAKKHNVQGTYTERAEQLKQMRDRWEKLYNQHSHTKISMKSLKEQGITDRKAEAKLTPSESAALQRKAQANRLAIKVVSQYVVQPEKQHRPFLEIFQDFKRISIQMNLLLKEQEKHKNQLDKLKSERETVRQNAWAWKEKYDEQLEQKSGLFGLMKTKDDERKTEEMRNKILSLNEKYEAMGVVIEKVEHHYKVVNERISLDLEKNTAEGKQIKDELKNIPLKAFDDVCEKWEKSFKEKGKEIEYNQNYSRIYSEVRGAGFNGDFGEKLHRCAVMEWAENETVKLTQKWEQEQKKQQIQQKKDTEKLSKHKVSRDDWEMER